MLLNFEAKKLSTYANSLERRVFRIEVTLGLANVWDRKRKISDDEWDEFVLQSIEERIAKAEGSLLERRITNGEEAEKGVD